MWHIWITTLELANASESGAWFSTGMVSGLQGSPLTSSMVIPRTSLVVVGAYSTLELDGKTTSGNHKSCRLEGRYLFAWLRFHGSLLFYLTRSVRFAPRHRRVSQVSVSHQCHPCKYGMIFRWRTNWWYGMECHVPWVFFGLYMFQSPPGFWFIIDYHWGYLWFMVYHINGRLDLNQQTSAHLLGG